MFNEKVEQIRFTVLGIINRRFVEGVNEKNVDSFCK